jgi:excisionase family DNA binding protein
MKLDQFEIDAIADAVARKLVVHGNGAPAAHTPRLLSVEQAADYIGRTKASVQHMVASGMLPSVRADRRVFLDRRDLDAWIEQNKTAVPG